MADELLQLGHTPGRLHAMKRQRGTTLLELMVAVAIVGILAAAGVPSLFQWLANVRLRSMADSVQNGIRLAEIEAIRRNSTVSIVFTNDNVPSAASTSTSTGRNWVLLDANNAVIQAKGSEPSSQFVQTPTPSTFTGSIVFNALGGNNLAAPLKLAFSRPTTLNGDHPLTVYVTPGGRVRMCDPSRTTGIGDTEACE